MKKLTKERQVVIDKIDHFEIRYTTDCRVRIVKTEQEARELAKQMEDAEKKRVAELNDEELREIEINKLIKQNLISLMGDLTNESRQHSRHSDEGNAEIKKNFNERLRSIINSAEKKAESY